MATIRWSDPHVVFVGSRPVVEFRVRKRDHQTIVDLSGYAAWVTYWYDGADPHVVRAALVDGVNGIARFFTKGDEFPSVGEVLFQATFMKPNGSMGSDRAWFSFSSDVVTWRVVATP